MRRVRLFILVFGKTSKYNKFWSFWIKSVVIGKFKWMLGTGKNQFVESTSTDGFFFSFIEVDWKCINCPLQRTVLQSHLRFNEFSWCGALAKRQKKLLPETGKKRKITWRIRKKRSKSVSIFTQKLSQVNCGFLA